MKVEHKKIVVKGNVGLCHKISNMQRNVSNVLNLINTIVMEAEII